MKSSSTEWAVLMRKVDFTAAYPKREFHSKMPFKRFLRSKKAQEGVTEPAKAARSLLLSGFVILVVMGIMMKSSRIFASEAGQSSDESLRRFAESFRKVANGSSERETVIISFTDGGHVLAVFDTRPRLQDTCQGNEEFKKPAECGNYVCACICDEDEGCEIPYGCKKFEDSKFGLVAADADFDENLGKEYAPGREDVLIYSNCDGWGGGALGLRWLIIEAKEDYISVSDKACGNIGGVCYPKQQGCPEKFEELKEYKCSEREICCTPKTI
jgi:hypothetical protein